VARRARLPEPQRELDLHGLPPERALARLREELAFCRARRISPLLVIVGRGWNSPDGRPVLAPAVRRWLEGAEARALGVREARPHSRGGALWVRVQA
jgi:DNA-nicking Smr family endonuclease